MSQPLRLAVLISGNGTTLENFINQIKDGSLDAKISVVISSNPKAYGLVRANNHGLTTHVVQKSSFADTRAFSSKIWELVDQAGTDLVCLAGFICLLDIPDRWCNKVINIHPALLPSFGGKGMYGKHVHQAVIDAGCKVSGCTVHFCDNTYDTGPIIVQCCCPVREGDTPDLLAARVADQERIAFPQAINLIAQNRVKIDGRQTTILRDAETKH